MVQGLIPSRTSRSRILSSCAQVWNYGKTLSQDSFSHSLPRVESWGWGELRWTRVTQSNLLKKTAASFSTSSVLWSTMNRSPVAPGTSGQVVVLASHGDRFHPSKQSPSPQLRAFVLPTWLALLPNTCPVLRLMSAPKGLSLVCAGSLCACYHVHKMEKVQP